MKLTPCYTKFLSWALLAGCATLSMSAYLARNLSSTQAQVSRSAALETIAKHKMVKNCLPVEDEILIGNEILLNGEGKSPTSCFSDPSGRVGYAAYLNNKLQVQYTFTPTEVNSKISAIKKENK